MATVSGASVKSIVVACEAGMGSSVMVAKQLKAQGVSVTHAPVNQLADTEHDLVLCHRGLGSRAKQAVPGSVVVMFDMFIGDLNIAKVVSLIQSGDDISDD